MSVLVQDQFDSQILSLVNQERNARGLGSLVLSENLDAAADLQSRQMAQQDYFSHTNPVTGSTIGSRAAQQGYTLATSRLGVSENIAAGYTSAESVVDAWMRSSGHRQNILNPDNRHLGVGYFYLANDTGSSNFSHYWTQVFGFGGVTGQYAAEGNSESQKPRVIEGSSAGEVLVGGSRDETLMGLGGGRYSERRRWFGLYRWWSGTRSPHCWPWQ